MSRVFDVSETVFVCVTVVRCDVEEAHDEIMRTIRTGNVAVIHFGNCHHSVILPEHQVMQITVLPLVLYYGCEICSLSLRKKHEYKRWKTKCSGKCFNLRKMKYVVTL